VVPFDFSDDSIRAIDTALQMVETPSQLHVIHVLPELQANEPGVVWHTIDDEGRKRHAKDAVDVRLSDSKYQGVDVVVDVGDAGHEIADFAKSIGAELIVMPSHGRRGLKRLLLGSVADRVVRLSHCPVLVLRG
jgi:nucleotide-binding universal stress UspA family protein